ncbi:hypothetical protein P8605_14200 [Streptomyces sp. T-3]|nr:hypothetical protein [Streptomyces sp. T-3]
MQRLHMPLARQCARRGLAMAAVCGVILSAAACSTDDKPSHAPSKQPSASSNSAAPSKSADPQDAEAAALLASYGSYWGAKVEAEAKASVEGTDLDKHTSGVALAQVKGVVRELKSHGHVMTGEPTTAKAPKVSLDLDRKVPRATITDCVDVSQWKLTDKKSGKPVSLPKNRLTKYAYVVTAERWGKQWMVLETKPQDRAC